MIEGNRLSEEAVTAVIEGKRILGPPKDILEVKNAQRAYSILDKLDPSSLPDLLRAHGTLMEGLTEDAGRFRSGNVGVHQGNRLIHTGTPARLVPHIVAELFQWHASTDMHPLISSCIFHYEFEFIHPFSDGNGRLGRLWHTLLLSRWRGITRWLPVESVIAKRQNDYYAALAQSNANGSSEVFVDFMLEVIRDSLLPFDVPQPGPIQAEKSPASQAEKTPADRPRKAPADQLRKAPADEVLAFFRANPHGTIKQLAQQLSCSVSTAERRVRDLITQGQLMREGSARAGTWQIPPE